MGGSESSYDQTMSCRPLSEFNENLFKITSFKMDVGIDDSLLKYSGIDSSAKLQEFSSELRRDLGSKLPDYIEKVGTALPGFSAVPNAVGIGALVISMILQVCFDITKDSSGKRPDTDVLLRRVFAEEKSSDVRDVMANYLSYYKRHLGDDRHLLEETIRLEKELQRHLIRLKNSMLSDGHMTDHALKHWTNGAAFHAQMLIHIARLKKKASDFETAKRSSYRVINTYYLDMYTLIEKYREYKTSTLYKSDNVVGAQWIMMCCLGQQCCETQCDISHKTDKAHEAFLKDIFSVNSQIINLKKYFSELQKNHDILINQGGEFKVPRNK